MRIYIYIEYKHFVQYSILAAALVLKRPDFKTRVIDAPEILEVIHEIPIYAEFATSLYNCNYSQFFKSLGNPLSLSNRTSAGRAGFKV